MPKIVAALLTYVVVACAFPSLAHAQQMLKVGTTTAGQPVSGRNPQTNEFEGVAVEVMMAVAREGGLQVAFQPMVFGELQPALLDKKIDVIAAGYGITPEREKVADFTNSYGSYRDVLVVPASDTRAYRAVADLKGMPIATPKGSAFASALKDAGANVIFVDGPVQALEELDAGHVAGVVDNGLQIAYRLNVSPHPKLKIVDSYPPIVAGRLAFAVQKGNVDLRNALNAALARAESNGTVKSIFAKWGLTN